MGDKIKKGDLVTGQDSLITIDDIGLVLNNPAGPLRRPHEYWRVPVLWSNGEQCRHFAKNLKVIVTHER
jgi:hypothetical protein